MQNIHTAYHDATESHRLDHAQLKIDLYLCFQPHFMASDSGSEETMPIGLKDIPILRQLYKEGILRAVAKPKFPVQPVYLDRVSLLYVSNL